MCNEKKIIWQSNEMKSVCERERKKTTGKKYLFSKIKTMTAQNVDKKKTYKCKIDKYIMKSK